MQDNCVIMLCKADVASLNTYLKYKSKGKIKIKKKIFLSEARKRDFFLNFE